MLKAVTNLVDVSQITGVLPVVNGGTGVTTSTGTGNTVLSAAPTLSGNVSLSTGNLIPATAGKGVDFSANTGTAGMTSELLNYYEEGTWTPTDNSGAGLVLTDTSGNCFYTRVGNLVTCTFAITFPSTVDATAMSLGGLPFTAQATTNSIAGGFITFSNIGVPVTFLIGLNTKLWFMYIVSTSAVIGNNVLSTKTFRGILTYRV